MGGVNSICNGSKTSKNMTKKHFIAFAKYIANLNPKQFGRGEREDMANMVAAIAAQDSSLFDKERFLKACGL